MSNKVTVTGVLRKLSSGCAAFNKFMSLEFQSMSFRIFVSGGKLCVSTDFGPGPNTFCHPSTVATGDWFRLQFTRLVSLAWQ